MLYILAIKLLKSCLLAQCRTLKKKMREKTVTIFSAVPAIHGGGSCVTPSAERKEGKDQHP